jgi:hypothetical protein
MQKVAFQEINVLSATPIFHPIKDGGETRADLYLNQMIVKVTSPESQDFDVTTCSFCSQGQQTVLESVCRINLGIRVVTTLSLHMQAAVW